MEIDVKRQYDKAKPLLETALEIAGYLFDEEHPVVLKCNNYLGILQREQQYFDEAESLFLQVIEGTWRKLGQEHPACFESMHELSVLYMK